MKPSTIAHRPRQETGALDIDKEIPSIKEWLDGIERRVSRTTDVRAKLNDISVCIAQSSERAKTNRDPLYYLLNSLSVQFRDWCDASGFFYRGPDSICHRIGKYDELHEDDMPGEVILRNLRGLKKDLQADKTIQEERTPT